MLTKQIIDSDAFLDMPQTSQCLYFHLVMRGDDDGFVGNPKKIMRMIGCSDDDLKVLIGKRFVLVFDNGVIVIKHWRMHNSIRKDRYTETQYLEEKSTLLVKENKSYTEKEKTWQPNGNQMATQVKLSKVKLSKDRDITTPQEESQLFFTSKDKQNEVITGLVGKGYSEEVVKTEIQKFVSYWTELNGNGKQQKWEMQKTFEVWKRLTNWLSNVSKFNNKPNKGIQSL